MYCQTGSVLVTPTVRRKQPSQADSSCKSDTQSRSSSILLRLGAGLPLAIPLSHACHLIRRGLWADHWAAETLKCLLNSVAKLPPCQMSNSYDSLANFLLTQVCLKLLRIIAAIFALLNLTLQHNLDFEPQLELDQEQMKNQNKNYSQTAHQHKIIERCKKHSQIFSLVVFLGSKMTLISCCHLNQSTM